jgi:hypothetical protein
MIYILDMRIQQFLWSHIGGVGRTLMTEGKEFVEILAVIANHRAMDRAVENVVSARPVR